MKYLLLPIILFIVSCSGSSKTDEKTAVEVKDDQTERIPRNYAHQDFTKNDAVINEWKVLRQKFKSVPFVSKTEIGNLYIFSQKKEFSFPNMYAEILEPYQKIGLTDAQGNILLADSYDKIGNPGAIASGYMEIYQNQKYGLFNYQTRNLVAPEFDVIFPSKIMGYVAIGKKGEHFYKIYEDGKILMMLNETEYPSYQKLGDYANFDIKDERIAFWVDTYFMQDYPAEEDYLDEINNALIVVPSYLAKLKVCLK